MMNKFLHFLSKKWIDVLRSPLIATLGYVLASMYRDNFSILTAVAIFNGMTVLMIVLIFIVWYILERRKRKV